MKPKRIFGISLVEALMVVTLAGIVAAVALPDFQASPDGAAAAEMTVPTVAAGAIAAEPVRDLSFTLLAVRAEQAGRYAEHGRFAEDADEFDVRLAPSISIAEYGRRADSWTLSLLHDAGVACTMTGGPASEVSLFCMRASGSTPGDPGG